MKTSRFFYDEQNNKIEIWNENGPKGMEYWKRTNGVSEIITERMYNNLVKKYNLSVAKTLARRISDKLIEFGLNNINEATTVTVDLKTKEVEVFDTDEIAFQGKESFCASQFVYETQSDCPDVNLDEIRNQTCVIK